MKISRYACDVCGQAMTHLTCNLHYFRIPIFGKTLSFALNLLGLEKGNMLDAVPPDLCLKCRTHSNLEAARALVVQFEKEVKDRKWAV